jgi:hypothetical protein
MFLGNVGRDRAFSARINELRKKLHLDEKAFAAVLREADAISGAMLAQITGIGPAEEDAATATSSSRPNRRRKSTARSRPPSRHPARKHRR